MAASPFDAGCFGFKVYKNCAKLVANGASKVVAAACPSKQASYDSIIWLLAIATEHNGTISVKKCQVNI